MSNRATPEDEEGSARDSNLANGESKGSTRASARSAASHEDTLEKSILTLQKLCPKHDQDMRELAGALTDFWLAPKSLRAVVAGLVAGADCMEEVKKREQGRRLGAPYTHVAAALVETLTADAEGAPWRMAERQETFCAFRVKEAYSAEEVPATKRKAKVTMTFKRARGDQERGRGRNGGRRARGMGRATSHRLNVESEGSREGSGSRTEDRARSSCEACSMLSRSD